MSKYKALIVGCGNMGALNDAPGSGNEHKTISYAKALKENGNFEVFYFDNDTTKVDKAIELWGGNAYECQHYEVVIIATPDGQHYRNLLDALICKPLLVICEKPLCSTVEEAEEIVKLYEDAGVSILVDYTRRFIPHFQRMKFAYDNGAYGKFKHGVIMFNRGIAHTLTHAIDFLLYLGIFTLDNFTYIDYDSIGIKDYRIWSIDLFFEKMRIGERRIGNMPVSNLFDHHTRYVIDNAYNFLTGKETLKCTAQDGLNALRVMEWLQP